MPAGALLETGGTMEKSAQSNAALLAQVPLMIALMLTVLMLQLGSFRRTALVVSVAPLGLIGVVAALLMTGTPMGFIATLGIIALAGMIIRNSVILVDQIEHERAHGVEPWQAVVDATMHRFRPIMLTAAAAILGMIPIMHDVFWGPMAYAIVGGLAVATALTLVFLPALYVTVNGIREPDEATAAAEFDPGGRPCSPALTVRRRAAAPPPRAPSCYWTRSCPHKEKSHATMPTACCSRHWSKPMPQRASTTPRPRS